VAFNFTTQMQAQVTNRGAELATGAGGLDTSGLQVNDASRVAMANDIQYHLGTLSLAGTEMVSDSKDESKQMQSAASSPRWGAWVSGTAEFADQDSTTGNVGYNYTTASPTIGLDYRLCPDFVLGALFNYANSGVDFADGSSLNINTEFTGLYGVYAHQGVRVSGMAGYGFNQYDSNRRTFGGNASSSPDGDEVTAGVTGAYDFKVGKHLVLSPEIGLDYTHLEVDGFSETGAGIFDLNEDDRNADSLRSHVGGRATATFDCGPVVLSPQINAAWYHEFLDNENGVSTSLPGAPALGSFQVSTTAPERDFALVGAGLNLVPKCCDNVTVFLNYDAQVGQSNFMASTVDGGVRIGF
jgi:outer membrane autotransporter protein